MKKTTTLFFLLLLFVSASVNLFSQDEQLDSLSFEVTTIQDDKPPYFALGGGYVGSFMFINMDALNEHFKNTGFSIPVLPSNMYVSGAEGFTAIGIVRNLRIGFYGISGSAKAESGTDTVSGTEITSSLSAFALSYGFLPFKHLAVLPSVGFGWSSLTIEAYKRTKEYDFNKFPSENDRGNYLHRADGSFFLLQPGLNLEYAVTPFLMARINVNYTMSFTPDWKYNRNATLNNVSDKIKTDGLGLQFGVFVGLFNY